MECPKCGIVLQSPNSECPLCAEKPIDSPSPASAPSEEVSPLRKPFAQITPYSGPYPPDYVQISSSESRPGPTNMLSKWIGALWSVIIPVCIALDVSGATTDRTGDTTSASGASLSIPVWIGLWAIVAIPAGLLYRRTRPKH